MKKLPGSGLIKLLVKQLAIWLSCKNRSKPLVIAIRLIEQLAIPLGRQTTPTKWLVIGCQKSAAKSLVIQKWLPLFLLAWLSSAQAGEKEIRQSLQSGFPKIGALEHIIKTPYVGLYVVIINGQLLYTDEQGQYLINGSVIEVKSRNNLSEQRRKQLFTIDFDKLPFDLAVKKVKGSGKHKLVYFTDPNCEYCKRLERELIKVSDVTLYVFLYPIFDGSDEVVRNINCAKDPARAWDDWMLKGIAPASASCTTSTEKVLALGKKLQINGTPNLIFSNGAKAEGFISAEDLEKRFTADSKK